MSVNDREGSGTRCVQVASFALLVANNTYKVLKYPRVLSGRFKLAPTSQVLKSRIDQPS